MSDAARHLRMDELAVDAPMPGITRRRIIGEQVMISEVRLAKGTFVPMHHHANEQMAIVVSGSLKFGILDGPDGGERSVTVGAGEVLHLPADVPHSALALEETVVLDVFSPPSATTGIDVGDE